MSAIDDLIAQIADPRLRARLAEEWRAVQRGRKFGLVFESHLPERLALPRARPRRGDLVCRRGGALDALWRVVAVREGAAFCVRPHEAEAEADAPRAPATRFALDEVMVVREFGEPIFPALAPVETVESGDPAGPWHVLIEADNYHALQLLGYLYAGKVDCIYIDPPYNTGARDWKYNNDYVDANDAWRHSKWLSMIERRLRLAKKLLNPADSVLIVTIDEKEVHRLGLLLEQVFPEARVQMVTSVINPSGSSRQGEFSRSDEYIFFVFVGQAELSPTNEDMLRPAETTREVRWDGLSRRGANGRRTARPNLFYPIFLDERDGSLHSVGEPLDVSEDRSSVNPPTGTVAIFPLGSDGTEMTWGLGRDKFLEHYRKGFIRFGPWDRNKKRRTIYHLQSGTIAAIERGEIKIVGREDYGALILAPHTKPVRPLTTWNKPSHSAGDHGSSLLRRFLPDRRFPFPKSLYAVEDALRFFVANKPDALIVDFFAGSGTTAHAVMRLNRQDGGRRRCVLVTNNEVAAEEAERLAAQGLKPGDEDWEKWGICRYIAFPRLKAAITGKTPAGEPVRGDYKFADEFPMSEGFAANLAYFRLDFLDKAQVALGHAFREILPLLWLKAGAAGPPPELPAGAPLPALFAPASSNFVVLLQEGRFAQLRQTLRARGRAPEGKGEVLLSHVFIVTDDDEAFKTMAAEVRKAGEAGPRPQVVQLYRDYLANFLINRDVAGPAQAQGAQE